MTKKRVLIIDDDIPLTQTMRINLEDTDNYEVEIVNDSLKAIATAREFRPDIILLDVVMPGYDGGDISGLLEKEALLKDVPVLIVTALVSSEEAGDNAIVEKGGQSMVPKPVRFESLAAFPLFMCRPDRSLWVQRMAIATKAHNLRSMLTVSGSCRRR